MLSSPEKVTVESSIAKNMAIVLDATYGALPDPDLMPRHVPTAKELVESALKLVRRAHQEVDCRSLGNAMSLLGSVEEKLVAALERMEKEGCKPVGEPVAEQKPPRCNAGHPTD